jgi:hypothetical protein
VKNRTIMMYGRTRSGKTSQVGELAEYVKVNLGKRSLIYTIDKGGVGPLEPYINLGIVDIISQGDTSPWLFLRKAATAQVRDKAGKWVPAKLDDYGLIAIESFTGFSDSLMNDLAAKAAEGINIGGAANVNFTINSDGESFKIGGSNMAHYGIVQTRMLDEFWRSQKLNVPFLMWTASASKEEDQNAGGKVIGPAGPGKALTPEIPRHCDLCFRIDCLPAQGGKEERHVIYLGNSVDLNAGNAVSLGNTRVPMGATLPATVEPASIVKVLQLIDKASKDAEEAIKKRLTNVK